MTERNESVYVWFDHSGRTPLWDVPDVLRGAAHAAGREFHPAWPDGRQHYHDLQVHPQMVVENAVDPHHFRFVHHTAISPVVLKERVEGHEWWARVGFGRGWRDHARDASGAVRTDTRNTIEILWSGMGISANVEHMGEGVRVITINITPVEDGKTEIFATYWIDRAAGDLDDGGYQRRPPRPSSRWVRRHRHLEQPDLPRPRPCSPPGGGQWASPPIRRWARQFYPGTAQATRPQEPTTPGSPTVTKLENRCFRRRGG